MTSSNDLKEMIAQIDAVIEANRAAGAENAYWYGVLDGLLHASDPVGFNLASTHNDVLHYSDALRAEHAANRKGSGIFLKKLRYL